MSVVVDIRKKTKEFSLDVSFKAENETLGLLGASGCGKSMTLKCIAGIETPDAGRITIDGITVFDSGKKINICPQKRKTGYLFQNYALFPTMTVAQNIGIAMKDTADRERGPRIAKLIEKTHLFGLENRYPRQLSGGQQQRTALARLLAASPRIIMLDEPFSALDSFLRQQMEEELLDSLTAFPGTILFVSHNRDEAFRICARLAVLHDGKKVREGPTADILSDPQTVEAARLTGCKNIAPATKAGKRHISVPSWGLTLETEADVMDDIKHAGIHAHHIRSARENESANAFAARISWFRDSPFSLTGSVLAGSSTEKLFWNPERADQEGRDTGSNESIRLCIPSAHILLLR